MKIIFGLLKNILLLIAWSITIAFSFALLLLSDFLQMRYDLAVINDKLPLFIIALFSSFIIIYLLELYIPRKQMMIIIPIFLILLVIQTLLPVSYHPARFLQSKLSKYEPDLLQCLYNNEDKEPCFDHAISKLNTTKSLYGKIGYEYCDKRNYGIVRQNHKLKNIRKKQCYYTWLLFEEKNNEISQ